MAMRAQRRGTQPAIGVVVVTHNSRQHLAHCLPPLLRSPSRPRVLVVNSSSGDGTVELAQAMGVETMSVARHAFNHGLTRELARHRLGTEIVVMLSPDAYPQGDDLIERLTAPLRQGEAVVAYGRQVAAPGSGLLERVGRSFNYPSESHVRSAAEDGTTAAICISARMLVPPGRTGRWTRSAASNRPWSPRRRLRWRSCWRGASASPTSPRRSCSTPIGMTSGAPSAGSSISATAAAFMIGCCSPVRPTRCAGGAWRARCGAGRATRHRPSCRGYSAS